MTIAYSDISSKYIEKFVGVIKKRYSIDFSGYSESFLRRRIASRINRLSIDTLVQYYEYMTHSMEELSLLLQNLTVNTSELNRNPEVFDIIAKKIIPQLLTESPDKILRFWTAGCSRGQEPYSLAIILAKMGLANIHKSIILATDIDDIAIKMAREGMYPDSSLENISYIDRKAFFNCIGSDIYGRECKIKDILKQIVHYRNHNIITGIDLGKFDMIICRNVAIYFSKCLQIKMFKRFLQDLDIGGYLIIGKSEMLPAEYRKHFEPFSLENRIYRKCKEAHAKSRGDKIR